AHGAAGIAASAGLSGGAPGGPCADDDGGELEPGLGDTDGPVLASEAAADDAAVVAREAEGMLQRAVDAGLDPSVARNLRRQMGELDVWRCSLGADPPAAVPPYEVQLKAGVRPFRAPARRQSDSQRESLRAELERMVQLGLMYCNPRATWGSAGMHIP